MTSGDINGWPEWVQPLQGMKICSHNPLSKEVPSLGSSWHLGSWLILDFLTMWTPTHNGLIDGDQSDAVLDLSPTGKELWTQVLLLALLKLQLHFFHDWTEANGTLESQGFNSTSKNHPLSHVRLRKYLCSGYYKKSTPSNTHWGRGLPLYLIITHFTLFNYFN